jgi:hypothetical protein
VQADMPFLNDQGVERPPRRLAGLAAVFEAA